MTGRRFTSLLPVLALMGCATQGSTIIPDAGSTSSSAAFQIDAAHSKGDSSTSHDTGTTVVLDTGTNPVDTGGPADTGSPTDTGMGGETSVADTGAVDTGLAADTGHPVDTGTPADTGSHPDVGTKADTGTDAGTPPADCVTSGGTCTTTSGCVAPSTVGDSSQYTCGAASTKVCCLPPPAPVTCTSVGGTCVALSPGSCAAPGTVGDATQYTCGSGVGLECCLPASSTAPACEHTGTAQEGWYNASGVICLIACAGLTATCERIGTTSQGWYTTTGHGCPPHTTEILHDSTCE